MKQSHTEYSCAYNHMTEGARHHRQIPLPTRGRVTTLVYDLIVFVTITRANARQRTPPQIQAVHCQQAGLMCLPIHRVLSLQSVCCCVSMCCCVALCCCLCKECAMILLPPDCEEGAPCQQLCLTLCPFCLPCVCLRKVRAMISSSPDCEGGALCQQLCLVCLIVVLCRVCLFARCLKLSSLPSDCEEGALCQRLQQGELQPYYPCPRPH